MFMFHVRIHLPVQPVALAVPVELPAAQPEPVADPLVPTPPAPVDPAPTPLLPAAPPVLPAVKVSVH